MIRRSLTAKGRLLVAGFVAGVAFLAAAGYIFSTAWQQCAGCS